jgi:hypothetical protein
MNDRLPINETAFLFRVMSRKPKRLRQTLVSTRHESAPRIHFSGMGIDRKVGFGFVQQIAIHVVGIRIDALDLSEIRMRHQRFDISIISIVLTSAACAEMVNAKTGSPCPSVNT